jgi:hypothetical protein
MIFPGLFTSILVGQSESGIRCITAWSMRSKWTTIRSSTHGSPERGSRFSNRRGSLRSSTCTKGKSFCICKREIAGDSRCHATNVSWPCSIPSRIHRPSTTYIRACNFLRRMRAPRVNLPGGAARSPLAQRIQEQRDRVPASPSRNRLRGAIQRGTRRRGGLRWGTTMLDRCSATATTTKKMFSLIALRIDLSPASATDCSPSDRGRASRQ